MAGLFLLLCVLLQAAWWGGLLWLGYTLVQKL